MFEKLKEFDEAYGKLITYACRIIFVLLLYVTTAYLDNHYIGKKEFSAEMAKLASDKAHYAQEQKKSLRDISLKLDALLLQNAANSEKFTDEERRVSRLEDKVDKLKRD
jgi:hypothetical protein